MEALVVMLVVSIFIAIIGNVIARKPKPKKEDNLHGRFECYYDNDKLMKRTVVMNIKQDAEEADDSDYCLFTPPKGVKYIIINAVGAGTSSSAESKSPGRFVSTFYTSSDTTYKLAPGKIGGSDTVITDNTSDIEILRVENGKDLSDAGNTNISDVQRCLIKKGQYITEDNVFANNYLCANGVVCEVLDDRVKVSFCRTMEVYEEEYLPWNYNKEHTTYKTLVPSKFIATSSYTKRNSDYSEMYYFGTELFSDYGPEPPSDWDPDKINAASNDPAVTTPSLYKLTLYLRKPDTTPLMSNYMEAMEINDGIGAADPGGIGKNGGILIIW